MQLSNLQFEDIIDYISATNWGDESIKQLKLVLWW